MVSIAAACSSKERQHVLVEHVHGGDRELARVEATPGEAAVAVEYSLEIDLADALERTDEERVDRDEFAGVVHLDLTLAELGAEAFKQSHLLIGQLEGGFAMRLFEPQQAVVLREQIVPAPDAAHAAGADGDAAQGQFMRHTHRAVRGELEAVIEDGLLDLGGQTVGVRALATGQFV